MSDMKRIEKIPIYGKQTNIIVKNFETLEEFQQYYTLHHDEIDGLSTTKLNRMFHIKDHKITRRKIDGKEEKTLCFRQLLKAEIPEAQQDFETEMMDLRASVKALEYENEKIKQQLLEIIKALNGSS